MHAFNDMHFTQRTGSFNSTFRASADERKKEHALGMDVRGPAGQGLCNSPPKTGCPLSMCTSVRLMPLRLLDALFQYFCCVWGWGGVGLGCGVVVVGERMD